MKRRTLLSTALAAGTATAAVACVKTSAPQTGSNEPGDSAFELESINYPSADTAAELYDELDYQRAVQGYIWAQPLVGLAAMAEGARRLGIAPLELFIFNELQQVNQKLQTGNDDVVYSFAYFDLSATGPLVVDIPGGGQYGVLLDAWQRPIEDVGGTGPDGGRGGRYLVVPPGHTAPLPDTGYFVCRSKTNTGMLFLRAVRNRGENVADAAARLQKTNMFAYAEVPNPPAPRFRPMNFDDYDGLTPHGLDYFTPKSAIGSCSACSRHWASSPDGNSSRTIARKRFWFAPPTPAGRWSPTSNSIPAWNARAPTRRRTGEVQPACSLTHRSAVH
jgi:hypothetical protein